MSKKISYRFDLDLLKGISIIAVVLYHIGWLSTGYLGVDVFFAINGFFILPGLLKNVGESSFGYFHFLLKRIMRLWPLVLLASAISFLVGAYGMLPDDFENLVQSVIATDLMSNNILAAITTKNYWDSVNEYKPLMHFWYVGILVEFYVLMPLVLLVVRKLCKITHRDYYSISLIAIVSLFLISLFLYLFSDMSHGDKFYFLPCRLFELLAGGLIGICVEKRRDYKLSSKSGNFAFLFVIILLFSAWYLPVRISSEISPVSGQIQSEIIVQPIVLFLLTIIMSCFVLASQKVCAFIQKNILLNSIAFLGKMSFSIFVWHQIILAFYRYYVSDNMSVVFGIALWIITIVLSILSYYYIEQRIHANRKNFVFCILLFLLTVLPAGWVYTHAGVIRDVPELNIKKGEVHRGMFAEYCDRVYHYDREFISNGQLKVLVEGVSFGRDFANILLESKWKDRIDLSYIFTHNEKYKSRYEECDLLFTFSPKDDIPLYVWNSISDSTKVIGLGTKNFGVCNGVIYQNRFDSGYCSQTIAINPNFYRINELWKQGWGADNYVDFLELSTASDGLIRVFTDDCKMISQDCRHLTKDGACWFATRIENNPKFVRWMNNEVMEKDR